MCQLVVLELPTLLQQRLLLHELLLQQLRLDLLLYLLLLQLLLLKELLLQLQIQELVCICLRDLVREVEALIWDYETAGLVLLLHTLHAELWRKEVETTILLSQSEAGTIAIDAVELLWLLGLDVILDWIHIECLVIVGVHGHLGLLGCLQHLGDIYLMCLYFSFCHFGFTRVFGFQIGEEGLTGLERQAHRLRCSDLRSVKTTHQE